MSSGFPLKVVMTSIALLALSLVPVVWAVRRPDLDTLAIVLAFDMVGLPGLTALLIARKILEPAERSRWIVRVWVMMSLVVVSAWLMIALEYVFPSLTVLSGRR